MCVCCDRNVRETIVNFAFKAIKDVVVVAVVATRR